MKFILTESKMEQVVFKYLDNQDFIKVEKHGRIIFVNSIDDEFGQIRYIKDNGWCEINFDLVDEISSFFSLEKHDSEKIVSSWVGNTLQKKVSGTNLFRIYK